MTETSLDCGACALKIENALKRLPGVSDISVNYGLQSLTLSLDEDRTSSQAVENKIRAPVVAGDARQHSAEHRPGARAQECVPDYHAVRRHHAVDGDPRRYRRNCPRHRECVTPAAVPSRVRRRRMRPTRRSGRTEQGPTMSRRRVSQALQCRIADSHGARERGSISPSQVRQHGPGGVIARHHETVVARSAWHARPAAVFATILRNL